MRRASGGCGVKEVGGCGGAWDAVVFGPDVCVWYKVAYVAAASDGPVRSDEILEAAVAVGVDPE